MYQPLYNIKYVYNITITSFNSGFCINVQYLVISVEQVLIYGLLRSYNGIVYFEAPQPPRSDKLLIIICLTYGSKNVGPPTKKHVLVTCVCPMKSERCNIFCLSIVTLGQFITEFIQPTCLMILRVNNRLRLKLDLRLSFL